MSAKLMNKLQDSGVWTEKQLWELDDILEKVKEDGGVAKVKSKPRNTVRGDVMIVLQSAEDDLDFLGEPIRIWFIDPDGKFTWSQPKPCRHNNTGWVIQFPTGWSPA